MSNPLESKNLWSFLNGGGGATETKNNLIIQYIIIPTHILRLNASFFCNNTAKDRFPQSDIMTNFTRVQKTVPLCVSFIYAFIYRLLPPAFCSPHEMQIFVKSICSVDKRTFKCYA